MSNSTPIIYLGKVGRLSILRRLFQTVLIPRSIWLELLYPLIHSFPLGEPIPDDIPRIVQAASEGWLRVSPLRSESSILASQLSQRYEIDPAESEAIALAVEVGAIFTTNDAIAYKAGREVGAETIWLTEVLLEALKIKLIKLEEFDDLIDQLVLKGMWIDRDTVNKLKSSARLLVNP